MIVKAVIRCGAGYFEDSGSEQFLMSPGQSGRAFRQFTYQRLQLAYRGLRESLPISCL